MRKFATLALTVGSLTFGGLALATTTASAQTHRIPAGDELDITPPIDQTIGQILAAPPQDRAVYEGRSVDTDQPRRVLPPTGSDGAE